MSAQPQSTELVAMKSQPRQKCCATCASYVPYRAPLTCWGRCFRWHGITIPAQDGTREEDFLPRVADLHLCSEWHDPEEPAAAL